jgi:hypothetical protein
MSVEPGPFWAGGRVEGLKAVPAVHSDVGSSVSHLVGVVCACICGTLKSMRIQICSSSIRSVFGTQRMHKSQDSHSCLRYIHLHSH